MVHITTDGHRQVYRCACRPGFFLIGNRSIEGEPEVCQPCPEGLRCYTPGLTIKTVGVAEGWWRPDPYTPVALRCRSPDVCLGVATNGSFSGRASNGCRDGHTGPFCEVCRSDHVRYLQGGFCIDCSAGPPAYAFVSVSLVGVIGLLAIATMACKTMARCRRMSKPYRQKTGRMVYTQNAGTMLDQVSDVLQLQQERVMQHVMTVRAIWSTLAIKAKIVISAIQAHVPP